jgi:hypothetical protein
VFTFLGPDAGEMLFADGEVFPELDEELDEDDEEELEEDELDDELEEELLEDDELVLVGLQFPLLIVIAEKFKHIGSELLLLVVQSFVSAELLHINV